MSLNEPLNAEWEAQAQQLAARIHARADDDILALTRLLVSNNDAEVFGDTPFQARTIVPHWGAVALEERLKKARLRRIQHRLPRLSASGHVPGLPGENATELTGTGPLWAGLLRRRRRVVGQWGRTLQRAGGVRLREILQALPVCRKPAVREKQAATLR